MTYKVRHSAAASCLANCATRDKGASAVSKTSTWWLFFSLAAVLCVNLPPLFASLTVALCFLSHSLFSFSFSPVFFSTTHNTLSDERPDSWLPPAPAAHVKKKKTPCHCIPRLDCARAKEFFDIGFREVCRSRNFFLSLYCLDFKIDRLWCSDIEKVAVLER